MTIDILVMDPFVHFYLQVLQTVVVQLGDYGKVETTFEKVVSFGMVEHIEGGCGRVVWM